MAKQPEPLAAVAACPALLEMQALRLLRVGCLGKAEAVVGLALLALAVRAALEAVALEVVAVVLAVALTQQALVVLAAMAGHWYWSIDYAAICRC